MAVERLGVDNRLSAAKLFMQPNQCEDICNPGEGHLLSSLPTEQKDQSEINHDRFLKSLLSIPAIGGKTNRLSLRRRYYHVIQIMLLALMAFSAVTITIAGIVHLFK